MTIRRTAAAYFICCILVFALGIHVLRIREMGLYLFIMAVGFPGSLAVVPISADLAEKLGWSLGSVEHVWPTALGCAAVNVALMLTVAHIVKWHHRKQARRAV